MNRRSLLAGGAVIVLLGACSSTVNPNSVIAQVEADVVLIGNGLQAVLAEVSSLNLLPATLITTLQGYVTDIEAAAKALATAATNVAAQPVVQQVAAAVQAIVTLLAALPLPPDIALAVQAAQVLIPIIEAAIGFLTTAPISIVMTPTEARLILAGMAAKYK